MGGGNQPSTTRTIQDIPREFKPAFTSLFNSAFGAARTGAYPSFDLPQGMGNLGLPTGQSPYPPLGGYQMPAMQMGAQPYQAGQPQAAGSINPPIGGGNQPQPPLTTPGSGTESQQQQGGKGSRSGAYWLKRNNYGDNSGWNMSWLPDGSQTQLPTGNVRAGSTNIPLAGGEPIIGQPYPGPFTAPTHPLELQSLLGRQQVGQQLGGVGQNLLNLGQATAGGAFLNPSTNPYLAATMQYAMDPAIQAFTGSVMPAFESQALQSGAYKGSSARDMAAATLANDFGRNLLGTTAAMGLQNLMSERQLQQGAGTMMDEAARLMQLSPEIMAQTGEGWRALQQRMLDEALLQYQEQIQAPYRPLMPLASIIQGGDIGSAITQMTPQSSQVARGITGALGGAGMGAGLASILGQQGWGGAGMAGAGGLLGGLAGALG